MICLMKLPIVAWRRVWFAVSGILWTLSLIAVVVWGLKPAIDFTGGSLMVLRFQNRPSVTELESMVKEAVPSIGSIVVQPVGDQDMQVRSRTLSEEEHRTVLSSVQAKQQGTSEERFDSATPVIGQELRQKTIQGIIFAMVLITLYIAYTFRKVSAPVQSWKYGVVTIIAAMHDVLIPIGVFALLGHYRGVEVGSPFVAALLTILGYSITDTIVVMDRIRENLPRMKGSFAEIVEASLEQTLLRSVYTSLTTLITLLAIFFFGGRSLHEFTLTMIIGIVTGTYSSIFIASPLLVSWQKWSEKRAK